MMLTVLGYEVYGRFRIRPGSTMNHVLAKLWLLAVASDRINLHHPLAGWHGIGQSEHQDARVRGWEAGDLSKVEVAGNERFVMRLSVRKHRSIRIALQACFNDMLS